MKQPKESTYIFIFYLNYSWVIPPTACRHKHVGVGGWGGRISEMDKQGLCHCERLLFCGECDYGGWNMLWNGARGTRWTYCFVWVAKPPQFNLHICHNKIQVSAGEIIGRCDRIYIFRTCQSLKMEDEVCFQSRYSTPLCESRLAGGHMGGAAVQEVFLD